MNGPPHDDAPDDRPDQDWVDGQLDALTLPARLATSGEITAGTRVGLKNGSPNAQAVVTHYDPECVCPEWMAKARQRAQAPDGADGDEA